MPTTDERLATLEQQVASFTSPSHADVLDGISDFLDRMLAHETEILNWLNGTATGGPSNDGKYPITDKTGFIRYLSSPAKMAFDQSLMTTVTLGASATIDASYSGKRIRCNNPANITLTFANGIPANFNCIITRVNTGLVTLAAATNAVLNNDQSLTRLRGRWSLATVICDAVSAGNSTFISSGSMIQV